MVHIGGSRVLRCMMGSHMCEGTACILIAGILEQQKLSNVTAQTSWRSGAVVAVIAQESLSHLTEPQRRILSPFILVLEAQND